jgi:alpha-ketoglutaric semialdehyde dehydrogenase
VRRELERLLQQLEVVVQGLLKPDEDKIVQPDAKRTLVAEPEPVRRVDVSDAPHRSLRSAALGGLVGRERGERGFRRHQRLYWAATWAKFRYLPGELTMLLSVHPESDLHIASIAEISNLVAGREVPASSGRTFEKLRPADGSLLCTVARSAAEDVAAAVAAARAAQPDWAARTPVERGRLVRELALALQARREEVADLVVEETGKARELALGEVDAAVEMGFFVAGEGRRLYGRTTTSAMPNRTVMATRRPVGVAALIVSFNTPLPNYAWKSFPAVFCGNTAVLKPSEHTPLSASFFGRLCQELLPPGVLNVVHGLGEEAGLPLVEHEDVDLVSFTGSASTGRWIHERAGRRLAKVCLELGGKNALVVCDDADLERAVEWSLASAFSNAGQRCAAASRLVVFDDVYGDFRDRLVDAARLYETGPLISEESLERILTSLDGPRVATGGERLDRPGWWLAPTVLENVAAGDDLSRRELFGPVTILYRVRDLDEAIELVNDSPYGLTAAIHTASLHRAMRFAEAVQAGVVVVNGGTHGSEPHMGFGGVKQSGTGWREAGVEALDVYTEWKYVNLIADPARV